MKSSEWIPQIYVVILTKEKENGADRIRQAYTPDHFPVDENVHLVLTSDNAKDVSSKAGLSKEGGSGAVFKLNSDLWGWEKPDLWNWIKEAKEKRDDFAAKVRLLFGES